MKKAGRVCCRERSSYPHGVVPTQRSAPGVGFAKGPRAPSTHPPGRSTQPVFAAVPRRSLVGSKKGSSISGSSIAGSLTALAPLRQLLSAARSLLSLEFQPPERAEPARKSSSSQGLGLTRLRRDLHSRDRVQRARLPLSQSTSRHQVQRPRRSAQILGCPLADEGEKVSVLLWW